MYGRFWFSLLLVTLLGTPAWAQNDRRDRQAPELVIETGGRTGACDFMTFTPDGRQLLAAGEDKVVRIWNFRDGKLSSTSRTLRWNSWRQQRGAIYALTLSPDTRKVVIGGYGMPTNVVALLDRKSAEVLALSPVSSDPRKTGINSVVRSLAFSPSGKRVAIGKGYGGIWLWENFRTLRPVRRGNQEKPNRVRLLHFLDEDHLLSVDEQAQVIEWDLAASPPRPRTTYPPLYPDPKLSGPLRLYRVALSPDQRLIAAATEGPVIVLRSLAGEQQHDIPLDKGEFPRSVAFRADGKQLAVAVGSLVKGQGYYMDGNDEIRLFDLSDLAERKGPPRQVQTLPHARRAEFLAYHPAGQFLAVAGGENHEVTVWDLKQKIKTSVARGKGTCLWDIALSRTGRYLGFRDQRDATSADPNRRGKGPWRVFDLPGRRWVDANTFEPLTRAVKMAGWSVEPDARDEYRWYAVDPHHKRHRLPHNRALHLLPTCYLFLPPLDKREGSGPRLAVGHAYGLTIYQLDEREEEARPIQLCTGHQGDVTALAASADGNWLVSASTDQTISAWSLKPWPSQPQLGASFTPVDDHLRVDQVDVGSPAWEAGLLKGDEIILVAYGGRRVTGTPANWLAALKKDTPGVERYFRVRRGKTTVDMLTTVRQRPLWQFFPMENGEWVLWMWRNPYYDTSTKGDFAIGWHVNARNFRSAPRFLRAERFRNHFERPDVIDRLLQTRNVSSALQLVSNNPVPLRFDEQLPPAVTLSCPEKVGRTGKFMVQIAITPVGDNPDYQPARGELWVNDFRPHKWLDFSGWEREKREGVITYQLQVEVAVDRLRAGRNILTFQSFNRLGGRSDAVAVLQCERPPQARPRLLGLSVGINKYGKGKGLILPGRGGMLGNLQSARFDAIALQEQFHEQANKPFAIPNKKFGIHTYLDEQLQKDSREKILAGLDQLAQQAGPDDRFVLFLAGHGIFDPVRTSGGLTPPDSRFVFCCPTPDLRFDRDDPRRIGLTSEELFDKLAQIPCPKLVIIDACHAGEATANVARNLTPSGQGPIIMAACDRNQQSYELPEKKHGVFTYAILQAFDEHARTAGSATKPLTVQKLYAYTRARVPELLEEIKLNPYQQVPILFAPAEEKPYLLATGGASP